MRRDVFQAIADPTRREIISLLVSKERSINDLAGNFDISRPAISKHVRILAECGLVSVSQAGRERFCYARPDRLKEVSVWVERYRRFWTSRLNALEKFLEVSPSLKKRSTKSKRKKP